MSIKKHVETLTRRAEYLEKRVAEAEVNGRGSSYDKAEASSLRFALDVIERVKPQLEEEETAVPAEG